MSGKIFVIGLPKTGMHSMKAALEELGYKAQRFVRDKGLFDTKDAFMDYPVFMRYKELDKKYPGSKFILTKRDIESWLASSQTHSKNQKGAGIPDQEKVEFFGATTFDRKKWKKAYIDHLADVRAYFEEREQDLLEMDLEKGDGWKELCGFLGHDTPDKPFPHKNNRRTKRTNEMAKGTIKKAQKAKDKNGDHYLEVRDIERFKDTHVSEDLSNKAQEVKQGVSIKTGRTKHGNKELVQSVLVPQSVASTIKECRQIATKVLKHIGDV